MARSLKRQVMALSFLLFAVAALTIWVRATTVRSTYQFVQNENQLRLLEQENQVQRVKWIQLTTSANLERLAIKLGLRAPQPTESNQSDVLSSHP